jgi:aromatic-L-amino-acid/L-tryptophan decarboxylase
MGLRHVEDATNWDVLIEAARVHIEEFLSVQRDPTSRPVSTGDQALRARLRNPAPLPSTGERVSDLLAELREVVLDQGYCNGAHPQYFGYFHPRPLPAAVLGDAIAALLNQSPAAWRMGAGATALECEVLSWLADFIGYGHDATAGPPGVFTSGGTMANLAALKLARDTILGREAQDEGLAASAARPTVYVSAENHYSIPRALDILGLGRTALRTIPTDRSGRVRVPTLRSAIVGDIEDGRIPICVIGLAVASGTGAVDPLDELADIATEYGIWYHVDGAAGGVFADLPPTRPEFKGLERADSVTLDPHKWLFLPYGIGCLLVRDCAELAKSFRGGAHYWQAGDDLDMVFMGPEGSRPWKSLGLWLTMRQLGKRGYAQLLLHNLEVAQYLADQVRSRPGYELLQEPVSPVCCFRALPDRIGVSVDRFNERLHRLLLDGGRHYVTVCRPGGRVYLRASINNYSTQPSHVRALLDALDQARGSAL